MTGIKINLKNLSLNGLINTTEMSAWKMCGIRKRLQIKTLLSFVFFPIQNVFYSSLHGYQATLQVSCRKQKINSKMNLDETAVEKRFC